MSIVKLYLKHADRASIQMDGVEEVGYLPYVNEVLGGDDTVLKIDNDTGRIIGWTPVKVDGDKFMLAE